MTAGLRPIKDTTPSHVCASCGSQARVLVRVNPRLGAMPELRTYRCERCGAVETVEVRQPAAGTSWHRNPAPVK